MEYFYQYIHAAGDPSCMDQINDITKIDTTKASKINNNEIVNYNAPILNYLFKQDYVYFICFKIKSANPIPELNMNFIDIQDGVAFYDNPKENIMTLSTINQFQYITYIMSPVQQDYNAIIWDSDVDVTIEDIKIYQVHNINFFEYMQDNCAKEITKIAIQGNPGTYVSFNRGCLRIDEDGIIELEYNNLINFVGVATLDDFIVDLTYKKIE